MSSQLENQAGDSLAIHTTNCYTLQSRNNSSYIKHKRKQVDLASKISILAKMILCDMLRIMLVFVNQHVLDAKLGKGLYFFVCW